MKRFSNNNCCPCAGIYADSNGDLVQWHEAKSRIAELEDEIAELEDENARLRKYEFASQNGHPTPRVPVEPAKATIAAHRKNEKQLLITNAEVIESMKEEFQRLRGRGSRYNAEIKALKAALEIGTELSLAIDELRLVDPLWPGLDACEAALDDFG